MKPNLKLLLKAFSIEVPVYGILVAIYGFLVLHYLGAWLSQLYVSDRKLYAAAALTLIIGQGYVLEILTRALLGIIRGNKEK